MEPSTPRFLDRVAGQSNHCPVPPSSSALDPTADVIASTEALVDVFRKPGPPSVVETSGPFIRGSIKSYVNFTTPSTRPIAIKWHPFAPDRPVEVFSADETGRYVFYSSATPEKFLYMNHSTAVITCGGLSLQSAQRSTDSDILQGNISMVRCLAPPPMRISKDSPLDYGIPPEQIISYAATTAGSAAINVPLSVGVVCLSGPPADGRLRVLTQSGTVEPAGAVYCPIWRLADLSMLTTGTTTREVSLRVSAHQFGRRIQGRHTIDFNVTIDPSFSSTGETGSVSAYLEVWYTDQSRSDYNLGELVWGAVSNVHENRTARYSVPNFAKREIVQIKIRLVDNGNLDNFVVTDASLGIRVPGVYEAVDTPVFVGYITGHSGGQVVSINTIQHYAVTPDSNLLINVKPDEHALITANLDKIRGTWDAAMHANPPLAYVMTTNGYARYCDQTVGHAGIIADLVRKIPVIGQYLTPFAYLGERMIAGLPPGVGQAGEAIGYAGDYPSWQPGSSNGPSPASPSLTSILRHVQCCSPCSDADTALAAATHVCVAFKDLSQSFFGRLPIFPIPADASLGGVLQQLYLQTMLRAAPTEVASAYMIQTTDCRLAVLLLNRTFVTMVGPENLALQTLLQTTLVGKAADAPSLGDLAKMLAALNPDQLRSVFQSAQTLAGPVSPAPVPFTRPTCVVQVDNILGNPNYTIDFNQAKAATEGRTTTISGFHATAFPVLVEGGKPQLGYMVRLPRGNHNSIVVVRREGVELPLALVCETDTQSLRFAYSGQRTAEIEPQVRAMAKIQMEFLRGFTPYVEDFVAVLPSNIVQLNGTSWSLAMLACALGGPYCAYSGSWDTTTGEPNRLLDPEKKVGLANDIGMTIMIQDPSFSPLECASTVARVDQKIIMTRDLSASLLAILHMRTVAAAFHARTTRLTQATLNPANPPPAYSTMQEESAVHLQLPESVRPLAEAIGVGTVSDVIRKIDDVRKTVALTPGQSKALADQRLAMTSMKMTPGYEKRVSATAAQSIMLLHSITNGKKKKKTSTVAQNNPFLSGFGDVGGIRAPSRSAPEVPGFPASTATTTGETQPPGDVLGAQFEGDGDQDTF